jgi:hypothetical protein
VGEEVKLGELIGFLLSYQEELGDYDIAVTTIPAKLDSRNLLMKTDKQNDLFGEETGKNATLTHDDLHP